MKVLSSHGKSNCSSYKKWRLVRQNQTLSSYNETTLWLRNTKFKFKKVKRNSVVRVRTRGCRIRVKPRKLQGAYAGIFDFFFSILPPSHRVSHRCYAVSTRCLRGIGEVLYTRVPIPRKVPYIYDGLLRGRLRLFIGLFTRKTPVNRSRVFAGVHVSSRGFTCLRSTPPDGNCLYFTLCWPLSVTVVYSRSFRLVIFSC